MASYVIMEPPQGGEERAVLVRDGLHVWALLLPFLWLLLHRLWIEAGLVIAAGLLIALASGYLAPGPIATVLSLGIAVFVGLEAANLRLAALRRRGWREWGVVEAANADEAETRYIAEAAGGDMQADDPVPAPAVPTGPKPSRPAGPALGLFSYPGRS